VNAVDLTDSLFEPEPVRMRPQLAAAKRLADQMKRDLPPRQKKEISHQLCRYLAALTRKNAGRPPKI
jgi:hypothetical protein